MEDKTNKKFYDDPKFMESFTEEQKAKLQERDSQRDKYWQGVYDDKIKEAEERGKEEAKAELEAQSKANAEKDQFLGSVPEANRKFIADAMDNGKSIDYIKKNYAGLLAKQEPKEAVKQPEVIDEPKEKPAYVDMQSFLDGRADQIGENQKSENAESDKDFMERTKKGGNKNLLDPSSPDWDKVLSLMSKDKN